MYRIACGGFIHETNSFSHVPATLKDFRSADGWPALCHGRAMLKAVKGVNIPIAGFLDAVQHARPQATLKPLLWCSAQPSGPVQDEAFDHIMARMIKLLKDALPLDALYLDLHGAMISESYAEAEGEIIKAIRAEIGDDIPIIVSLDMHANVSETLLTHVDWVVGFRTYPHIDMADTGKRAANAMFHLLDNPLKHSGMAVRRLPFLLPITQQCTLSSPMNDVQMLARHYEPPTASLEFFTGFPPSDSPATGPSVVGFGFDATTKEAVDMLADHIETIEPAFATELFTPADAIATAKRRHARTGKPIIIADTQDNPGAGGTCDSTGMLRALIANPTHGAVLGCIYDPPAARKAHKAGTGATITVNLGNHSKWPQDSAISLECTVEHITEAPVKATGPMYGGSSMALGKMAVLNHEGMRIIIISVKQQCADQSILRHVGIPPEDAPIIILKSSVHFRADFESIAGDILIALADGINAEDPAQMPYKHLPEGKRLRPRGPTFTKKSAQAKH